MSRMVKEKEKQQTISLADFETLQKTKISPHWRAERSSERPKDWIVSAHAISTGLVLSLRPA